MGICAYEKTVLLEINRFGSRDFEITVNLRRRTRSSPLRERKGFVARRYVLRSLPAEAQDLWKPLSFTRCETGCMVMLKNQCRYDAAPNSTCTLGVHTSLRLLGGIRASRARPARRRSAVSKTISFQPPSSFQPPARGVTNNNGFYG